MVFAVIGLALGLTVARDGKLAGFVVGIAVIFAYYILMFLAESLTKGHYRRTPNWRAGCRTSCSDIIFGDRGPDLARAATPKAGSPSAFVSAAGLLKAWSSAGAPRPVRDRRRPRRRARRRPPARRPARRARHPRPASAR